MTDILTGDYIGVLENQVSDLTIELDLAYGMLDNERLIGRGELHAAALLADELRTFAMRRVDEVKRLRGAGEKLLAVWDKVQEEACGG